MNCKVAQSVEQRPVKPLVAGSSPAFAANSTVVMTADLPTDGVFDARDHSPGRT